MLGIQRVTARCGDLEVKVCAGRPTTVACPADQLALSNLVTSRNRCH
jgi:hypothetical protein